MLPTILLIATTVLALLRMAGVTHIAFQAIAHVFVGGLIGAWLADRKNVLCARLALSLTAVEVACFVAFRLF